jgi:hypothetical protein
MARPVCLALGPLARVCLPMAGAPASPSSDSRAGSPVFVVLGQQLMKNRARGNCNFYAHLLDKICRVIDMYFYRFSSRRAYLLAHADAQLCVLAGILVEILTRLPPSPPLFISVLQSHYQVPFNGYKTSGEKGCGAETENRSRSHGAPDNRIAGDTEQQKIPYLSR